MEQVYLLGAGGHAVASDHDFELVVTALEEVAGRDG